MLPPYLLAILLPRNVEEEISRIQEQFRTPRWNKTLGPHITLVAPFTLVKSEEDLKKALHRSTSRIPSFEITLKGMDAFIRRQSVIFVRVQLSEELQSLQTAAAEITKEYSAPSFRREREFHPHVTLSNRLLPHEYKIQYGKLKKLTFHYSFMCDQFHLLTLQGGRWVPIEEFYLEK